MSVITELKQFEVGMLKDARDASKPQQGKTYMNLDQYLAQQANEGKISQDLITTDPKEQEAKFNGRQLSPIRQLLADAGVTFLGKNSSGISMVHPKSPDRVRGSEVLFFGLMQNVFESAVEGTGLSMEVAQGGFATSPSSATNLLYRDVVSGQVIDNLINPLEYVNLVRLGELVSMNTGINSDSYRGLIIEDTDTADYEFGRVAEYGEIPYYVLSLAERAMRVYKRGGGIKASYEVLRRQSINQFAMVVVRFGIAKGMQLLKDALTVAVNGDGNANSGANNTGVVNAPTIQVWDEYAIDTERAYTMGFTHAAGDNTEVKLIRALRYPTANLELTADQQAMFTGGTFRTPGMQTLRTTPEGSILDGTRKTLWWNQANGLEQVTENGSQVEEADRFILTQEEVMTMTYNTGFSKPMLDSFHTATRAA